MELELGARAESGAGVLGRFLDAALAVEHVEHVEREGAHRAHTTLLAEGSGGARELGRYTFQHRPWPGHQPMPAT